MFDMKKFGERLVAERERLGLTQSDVVKKTPNITQVTLSRYENGTRVPTLQACTDFYNIGYDLMYLVSGEQTATGDINDTALTPNERQWLGLYRSSRDSGTLLRLVEAFENVGASDGSK